GARAQTRSLCDMATSMGLSIVAEGVEGGEQASALTALGCPLAQGYFFSPPVPAEDAGRLLDDQLVATRHWPPDIDERAPRAQVHGARTPRTDRANASAVAREAMTTGSVRARPISIETCLR